MPKENPFGEKGVSKDKAEALEKLARDMKILRFREEAEQRNRIEAGPEVVDILSEVRSLIEEKERQKLVEDVNHRAKIFMQPPFEESDPSRYLNALIRLRTFYPQKAKEFQIDDTQWNRGMEYLEAAEKEAQESDHPAYALRYLTLADSLKTIDPGRFQSIRIPQSILEKITDILKEDAEDARQGDLITTGDFMERYAEAQNVFGEKIQKEFPIDEVLWSSIVRLIQNPETYIEQGALISLANKIRPTGTSEIIIPRELWDEIREELLAYGIVDRERMERIDEPISRLMDLKVESKSDYLKRIQEQTNIQ